MQQPSMKTAAWLGNQKRSQNELRVAHEELELRVAERTAELARANETLLDEIEVRQQTEQALEESESRFRLLDDVVNEAQSNLPPRKAA